jgi:hypothetical protein
VVGLKIVSVVGVRSFWQHYLDLSLNDEAPYKLRVFISTFPELTTVCLKHWTYFLEMASDSDSDSDSPAKGRDRKKGKASRRRSRSRSGSSSSSGPANRRSQRSSSSRLSLILTLKTVFLLLSSYNFHWTVGFASIMKRVRFISQKSICQLEIILKGWSRE